MAAGVTLTADSAAGVLVAVATRIPLASPKGFVLG